MNPTRQFVSLALLMAAVLPVVAASSRADAAGSELVIEGRGWGHGVGLAQDGALAMGRAGADVGQILDHFYPGTTDGSAGGTIRVPVATGPSRQAIVSFPSGGEVRTPGPDPQPAGFPVVVPPATPVTISVDGDRVLVSRPSPPQLRPASAGGEGAMAVRLLAFADATAEPPPSSNPGPTTVEPTTTTTLPPPAGVAPTPPPPTDPHRTEPRPAPPTPLASPVAPTPLAPPAPAPGDQVSVTTGPVVAVPHPGETALLVDRGRHYRGTLEIANVGGSARVVDELDVEDYLRGMGEVRDPSWPAAALQAQAVAARTFALHAVAGGGEICADDRCQVYLGADVEYRAMDDAVRATRSRVRRIGRELATTFYSANAGGVSATPEEGFGPGGSTLTYLRAEPYPTDDPDPWTVRVTLDEAGRRLKYPGRLSGASVSRVGPSGRALDVALDGDGGPLTLSGQDVEARLQLRSTLFGFRADTGEVAAGLMVPADPPDIGDGSGGGGGALASARPVGAQGRRPGGGAGLAPLLIVGVLSAAVLALHRCQAALATDGGWWRNRDGSGRTSPPAEATSRSTTGP